MSGGWTLVLMVVCVAVGWLLCSYYEQQARIDKRRNGRIVERAYREDRVAR